MEKGEGKSHAQGFLCRGSPRGKPFSFDHTKTGFSKLEGAVSALRGETGKEPAVAFEHTGVYSRVVAKWAESAGIRQIAVSPLLSAKARKSRLRPTKNDSLDCNSIAEAAYGSDVGERLAASILAEIGDVARFPSQGKIAAYAGLDPAVCQSGRSSGLHLRITRKGNAFLRKYLYLAVVGCCSKRRSNRIKEFVDRKQKGGLPRKAALVAGCRKMLLVIRAMLLNGTAFEH